MFRNDYSEIAAPEVLEALRVRGLEQNVGYGLDVRSDSAEELILKAFGLTKEDARVFFLAGGTQSNAVVISYLLRPYEGVICCDTGHINGHETGAVEGTGHKILACPNADGKLLPADIERQVLLHDSEHVVKAAMVYVSDTTETGTVYTRAELTAIRQVCDKYGLKLFMDGARLGAALTAPGTDVDAAFIGSVCDAFYVGGTKNGALFGEAVVLKNTLGNDEFRYHIKNRGAMLAKGFVLGIQFEALFADGLYFRLAQNSNDTAALIREGLKKAGVMPIGSSNTNQIFITLSAANAAVLMERFGLELWEDLGEEKTVRIVTSFATKKEDCEEFIAAVTELVK